VVKLKFDGPSVGEAAACTSADCQRQLLPLVGEIVRTAVAAGWSEEDVLLALVELAWDLHEKRRGDL
jgi:hypothetical protein